MSATTTATTTTTTSNSSAAPAVTASSIPRGPARATLNFYTPPADGSSPWNYVEIPKEGPQRNYGAEAQEVTVQDLRGRESEFEVDTHGFAVVPASAVAAAISASAFDASEADFSSDAAIEKTYYPQVRALLTSQLSGHPTRIVLFDHTIRRNRPDAHRAPVQRTHIDQTRKSAAQRVRFHMDESEAETLLAGRVRIVNVWRPLNGPVETHPLAMGDSSSVKDELLVPIEHRYPTRTGETAGVRFSPDTRYYYWSGMDNDERILLQCYDSLSGTRVPHTAFEHPGSTEQSKPRESIEVRALVFG